MCKMKLLLVAVSSMFTLVLGTDEYMTDKNINQMKLELATLMKEELYKVDRDFDFIKLQFTVAKTNKNIEKCARAPIKQERYAVRSAVKKKMGLLKKELQHGHLLKQTEYLAKQDSTLSLLNEFKEFCTKRLFKALDLCVEADESNISISPMKMNEPSRLLS